MPVLRLTLAALLLAACGSSRPSDSTSSTADRDQPPDAGVSLGRPSEPAGKGGPELPPTVLRNNELESRRLSGNKQIAPDADDNALRTKESAMAAVKFCVDASGKVSSTKILRSSGSERFDQKIVREIGTWTYQPVVSEGQTVDVCTVVTFLYRRSATPPPAAAP